ncbi:MAG: transketolase [Bacteriovoracaceae bacterium]|nr:transketolase [Bacteriovoracaceae bacterium]
MKLIQEEILLANTPQNQPVYQVKIKSKSGKEVICADPKATRALVAIMDMYAVNGGAACHWGGPAAMAEVMSALHSIMFKEKNWFEHFNFVNDIGHAENGLYALRANWKLGGLSFDDLWKFRSIQSKLTGHGEAHLYPEGVLLSNGPLSSALAQAQGLAMGDIVAKNSRTTICALSDGAAMEGEAREAFAAIAGLASKGKLNPFVLIISDNNTKLSGRINDDSFDMKPTFRTLETLGWKTVFIEDGHNLELAYQTLERAFEDVKSNPKAPVALVFKTTKGYGVKSTAESKTGGHGFPLKAYSEDLLKFVNEIYHDKAPAEFLDWAKASIVKPTVSKSSGDTTPTEKIQVGISKAAIRAAKEGLPVFSISSDLQGSTGMADFHKAYPNLSVDVGIAESNMVSAAAGMSKVGFVPIVDTFAAFGVTKGNLPLIMASLSKAPIIAVFSHTGFQDAADGASHQSLTYLAATSAIPYVKTVVLSCSEEAEALMYEAITSIIKSREAGEHAYSYVFFLGRENFPKKYSEDAKYQLGEFQILKKGTAATVVANGAQVAKALKASELLAKDNIQLNVINVASVNDTNYTKLQAEIKKTNNLLVTVEDHQIIGGMGSIISHGLLNNGFSGLKLKSLAVHGEFGQSAYSADELYRKHEIDEVAIVKAVKSLL